MIDPYSRHIHDQDSQYHEKQNMKAISQSLTMITLLALAALISEADIPTAAKIAQRILSAISKPFELYKQELFVTA